MTTLYLVRHGETKDNVEKIMQGQRQGELTPVGARQIEELSSTLSGIHFDAIADTWPSPEPVSSNDAITP